MQRPLLLAGLVYLLILVGLATLGGGLLGLALPLVLYLLVALLYGPEELQLKVTRTISADRAFQGTPVDVMLSITNEGSTLDQVLVEDLVPGSLKLTNGETEVLTRLQPGETVELEYTEEAKRGIFDFQEVQVIASDRLRLFRRQAVP